MLLDVLAVHRLTRLVTADVITRPARARIIALAYGTDEWKWPNDTVPVGALDAMTEAEWDNRPESDDEAPKLAAFVKCRWCTSIWISLGVVAARRYAPVLWEPLAKVLAFSTVAVLVSDLEQ